MCIRDSAKGVDSLVFADAVRATVARLPAEILAFVLPAAAGAIDLSRP